MLPGSRITTSTTRTTRGPDGRGAAGQVAAHDDLRGGRAGVAAGPRPGGHGAGSGPDLRCLPCADVRGTDRHDLAVSARTAAMAPGGPVRLRRDLVRAGQPRPGWAFPGWAFPGWAFPGWAFPGWAFPGWAF